MRTTIIAGNWKMFKTPQESVEFVARIKGQVEVSGVEAVICAPFTHLASLVDAVKGTTVKVGAQNVYFEDNGAFTGEVSGGMLKALGVHYVIVGHSERRQYFYETDEIVNKKVHAAFRNGLIPIVCVGETLAEREGNQTKQVCQTQIKKAFSGVTADQMATAIVAYEPIWAIGTGKSSTPQEANEVISYIRTVVASLYNEHVAQKVCIQYGGSVKPENVSDYLEQSDIDGALVGGASLQPESFLSLVRGRNEK